MSDWTPETWCACPRCNGPSFPAEVFAWVDVLACDACGHEWTGTTEQARLASRMQDHREGRDLGKHDDVRLYRARRDWWDTQALDWRCRMHEDREKLHRAMEGRW